MSVYAVESTSPYYPGRDGLPLQGGKIYFGSPSQNPVTNAVTVYWDSAATQPALQPIAIVNGRTVRSDGSPARVYAPSDYSVLVQDADGGQVLYVQTSQGSLLSSIRQTTTIDQFSGTGAPATYSLSITPASKNDTDVYVSGVYQPKSTYTLVGNQLTITAATASNNIEVVSAVLLDYATISAAITAAKASAAGSAATAVASQLLADADAAAAHTDRLAADADLTGALAAKVAAEAASAAAGSINFYDTRALADAALAGLANLAVVEVAVDETRGNLRARYRKESGVYVFKFYPGNAFRDIYVKAGGSDANAGTSDAAALATIAAAKAMLRNSRDRIRPKRGSVFRETVDPTGAPADVEVLPYGTGARPIVSAHDVVSSFTVSGAGPAYSFTVVLAAIAVQRGYPAVFEDGTRLAEVIVGDPGVADAAAAIAKVAATPGTFYFAGPGDWNSGWSAGTKTYYIQSSNGTNPNTNGKLYETPTRQYTVVPLTTSNVSWKWRNIAFHQGFQHDGLAGDDYEDVAIMRLGRHGNLPNVPLMKNVIVTEPNPRFSGALFHSDPPVGQPDASYQGCFAIGDESQVPYVGIGFFSHGGSSAETRVNAYLRDCGAYNVNTVVNLDTVRNVYMHNFRARNFDQFAQIFTNMWVYNADVIGGRRSDVTPSQQWVYSSGATGAAFVYGGKFDLDSQHGFYSSGQLGSLTMEDCLYVFRPQVAPGSDALFFNSVGATAIPLLSIKRSIIVGLDTMGFSKLLSAGVGGFTSITMTDVLLVNHKTSDGPVQDPICAINGSNTTLSALAPSARVFNIDGDKCLLDTTPGQVTFKTGTYRPGDYVFSGVAHPGGANQPRSFVAVGDVIMAGGPVNGQFVLAYTPTAHLRAACYCPTNTSYVAVGDGGLAVKTSASSATSWSTSTSGTANTLRACAAVGTTVLAVGDSGTIIRSTDSGSTWATVGVAATAANLRCVAMNGTTAVAAGDSGKLVYSTDTGATWTEITVGTDPHYALFYSSIGSTFVLGSELGALRTCVPANVATVGNWTSRTSGTRNRIVSFAICELKIVAALRQTSKHIDTFLSSTDSTTWAVEPYVLPFEVRAIAGGGASLFLSDAMLAVGESQSIAWRRNGNWGIERARGSVVHNQSAEKMSKWKAAALV